MTAVADPAKPAPATHDGNGLPVAHIPSVAHPRRGLCGAPLQGFEPLGPFRRCERCNELGGHS